MVLLKVDVAFKSHSNIS